MLMLNKVMQMDFMSSILAVVTAQSQGRWFEEAVIQTIMHLAVPDRTGFGYSSFDLNHSLLG
jgi:hypothetical protein